MGDVARWYAGRSVLVTGGTGFMGKVLLEKLLRSCPDIGKVYILCRAKRGLTPKARLAEFSKLPVFERLRKECPAQLSRLHIIEGDILQANLGIKDSDLLMLQEEVSVVFNGAASLKLEAELKENVAANTRGTQRLLDIALKMKKLVGIAKSQQQQQQQQQRKITDLYVLDRIGHALILFLLGWLLMKSVFLLEYLLQNATQGNFKLPFTSSTSVFMKT
ncbi:putative fatty acyl-CoA reductase CG5065 [Diaphorina citri]|uniref:Fatty acyl-CoA reductase n=1 Tax=Diaphorina citri TaxID=121845 RepID=A0A3Q0JD48_DIACI|nr:putative fatty acyl-CoA reductase CG5065 [Diaphorina citri]